MDNRWIKGTENEADVFTKNLHGPAFKNALRHLLKKMST